MHIQTSRRQLLGSGGLLGLIAAFGSAIAPRFAFAAWNKTAFEGKTLADTYKAMGAEGAKDMGRGKDGCFCVMLSAVKHPSPSARWCHPCCAWPCFGLTGRRHCGR